MGFMDKFPDWLRWLLFLPTAFVALFISYPLIKFVNKITMVGMGEGFFTNIVILILANLWSAVAFIWVGAAVVPRHNFIISIILAVFYSFILGVSFFAKFTLGEQSSVSWLEMGITIVAGIVAAVGVVYNYYEKEKDNSSSSNRVENELL